MSLSRGKSDCNDKMTKWNYATKQIYTVHTSMPRNVMFCLVDGSDVLTCKEGFLCEYRSNYWLYSLPNVTDKPGIHNLVWSVNHCLHVTHTQLSARLYSVCAWTLLVGWHEGHPVKKIWKKVKMLHQQSPKGLSFGRLHGTWPNLEWSPEKCRINKNRHQW